jgi:transposase
MPMLADLVELARRGRHPQRDLHRRGRGRRHRAVMAQATVTATPAGYQQLLKLADQRDGRRVWAIESTGGYGAGLTRFLQTRAEQVELDRPKRAARRHGAKSDPLDATRAAREALGRDQLAQPRGRGPAGGVVGAADRPPLSGPGRQRRPTPAARARGRHSRFPPWTASG